MSIINKIDEYLKKQKLNEHYSVDIMDNYSKETEQDFSTIKQSPNDRANTKNKPISNIPHADQLLNAVEENESLYSDSLVTLFYWKKKRLAFGRQPFKIQIHERL